MTNQHVEVNAEGLNLLFTLVYMNQMGFVTSRDELTEQFKRYSGATVNGNQVEIKQIRDTISPKDQIILAGLRKDWRGFFDLVRRHPQNKKFLRSVLISTRMVYQDLDNPTIVRADPAYDHVGGFLTFQPLERCMTTLVSKVRVVNGITYRYVFLSSSAHFVSMQNRSGDIIIRFRCADTDDDSYLHCIESVWAAIARMIDPCIAPMIASSSNDRSLLQPSRFVISDDPQRRSFTPAITGMEDPSKITWKVVFHDYIYGSSLIDYVLLKNQLAAANRSQDD